MEWVERGGSYAILLALWITFRDVGIAAQALSLKLRFTTHTKTRDTFLNNPTT